MWLAGVVGLGFPGGPGPRLVGVRMAAGRRPWLPAGGGRLLFDRPSVYGPAASGSHGSPAVSLVSTSAGGCPCLRAVDR